MSIATATDPVTLPYELKPQPYSSHTILLGLLPEKGNGRRVLDLGCASGYLSTLLSERGFSVTAVDVPGIQPPSLPASVVYREADLDQGLPPLEGKFDFVICADLLEHLRRPENLLRQIRAVMAPGGKLIGSLPNSGNIYFRLNVLLGRFPLEDRGLFDRTHVRFFMWSGWNDLLSGAGFRIASVSPTVIPFSLVVRNEALSGAVEAVYAVAARLWKKLFAYQFVVVAETT